MGTKFETVYASALSKFRSYEVSEMQEENFKEYMYDFLVPSCSKFHICRKDLSDRDKENECFNSDLTEMEIEILSNYLLLEYLDATYIRTPLLLKVDLSSSDFNSFNNAVMLGKLLTMHDEVLHENEALVMRYSWQGMRNGENDAVKAKLKNDVSGRR